MGQDVVGVLVGNLWRNLAHIEHWTTVEVVAIFEPNSVRGELVGICVGTPAAALLAVALIDVSIVVASVAAGKANRLREFGSYWR